MIVEYVYSAKSKKWKIVNRAKSKNEKAVEEKAKEDAEVEKLYQEFLDEEQKERKERFGKWKGSNKE